MEDVKILSNLLPNGSWFKDIGRTISGYEKKMAVGALIALKPLEIQKHLFYEKIIEI